jgi:hypothetical protein
MVNLQMPPPSHRCKVCGALWIQWPMDDPITPGCWTLYPGQTCGKCCDNVAMGEQIEKLEEDTRPPLPATSWPD